MYVFVNIVMLVMLKRNLICVCSLQYCKHCYKHRLYVVCLYLIVTRLCKNSKLTNQVDSLYNIIGLDDNFLVEIIRL